LRSDIRSTGSSPGINGRERRERTRRSPVSERPACFVNWTGHSQSDRQTRFICCCMQDEPPLHTGTAGSRLHVGAGPGLARHCIPRVLPAVIAIADAWHRK
jgi:hypothetical protein